MLRIVQWDIWRKKWLLNDDFAQISIHHLRGGCSCALEKDTLMCYQARKLLGDIFNPGLRTKFHFRVESKSRDEQFQAVWLEAESVVEIMDD